MVIKRHLITFNDSFGVASESWFESYSSAIQIAGMIDGTYVGMRVWPAPDGTIPVTDTDLRNRIARRV